MQGRGAVVYLALSAVLTGAILLPSFRCMLSDDVAVTRIHSSIRTSTCMLQKRLVELWLF